MMKKQKKQKKQSKRIFWNKIAKRPEMIALKEELARVGWNLEFK